MDRVAEGRSRRNRYYRGKRLRTWVGRNRDPGRGSVTPGETGPLFLDGTQKGHGAEGRTKRGGKGPADGTGPRFTEKHTLVNGKETFWTRVLPRLFE